MQTNKRLARKEWTMATCYGPVGEKYCKRNAFDYAHRIAKIMKAEKYCFCTEPSEKDSKSDYHIHLGLWLGEDVTKQITKGVLRKISVVLKGDRAMDDTHDFTSSAKQGVNALGKRVSDMKYAMGKSVKDGVSKTHHDVYVGPGYNELLLETSKKLEKMKQQKEEMDGIDPSNIQMVVYWLMKKKGLRPFEIVGRADAENPPNYLMSYYVESNLDKLNSLAVNIKKVKGELNLQAVGCHPPNAFQKACNKIMEETTNNRHNGQLNVFRNQSGDIGKSEWLNQRYQKLGSPEFPNAKSADVARAYSYEPEVNFNFARHVDPSKVNYSVIENLLDGKIFSPKYESGMKRCVPPKINIMCNSHLCYSRMSHDRWNVWEWDAENEKLVRYNVPKPGYEEDEEVEECDEYSIRIPPGPPVHEFSPLPDSPPNKKRKIHEGPLDKYISHM